MSVKNLSFYLRRDEPLMLKTKYLVYKGCKKNIHRWKLNGDRGKSLTLTSGTSKNTKASSSIFGSTFHGREEDKIKKITDQEKAQENIRTSEKMSELRLKLELANSRKKLKTEQLSKKLLEKPLKEPSSDKIIQKHHEEQQSLSAESKMKIKANLSRNRSFRTLLNPSNVVVSPSLTSFETSRGTRVKESFSIQDFGAYGLLLEEFVGSTESTINATPKNHDDSNLNVDFNASMAKTRIGRNTALAKTSTAEINEYFILPKLIVRKDPSLASEVTPYGFENFISKSGSANQHSTESLTEYSDFLISSSMSSLVSYQRKNRFYHSDLNLNQLTSRFKTKLSLSNQDIKDNEGTSSNHGMFLSDANFDKWVSLTSSFYFG